jgi:hypothetical protein
MIGQLLPPLANLFTQVWQALSPLVSALADAFQPLLPVIASLITDLVHALAPFLRQLVTALAPILPVLSKALGQLLIAFRPIFPILGQILSALVPLIPPLAKIIVQLLDLAARLAPAFIAQAKLIAPVLRLIVPVINLVASAFSGVITAVQHVLSWFGSLFTNIKKLPGEIAGLAGDMLKAGEALIKGLFNGLVHALGAAVDFAADVGKAIANGIIGFINKNVIDPVKGFKFTVGAFGIDHTFKPFGGLPDIPTLAEGGKVNPRDGGVLAILAERGKPEAVVDYGLLNRQLELSNNMMQKLAASGNAARGGLTQHIHGAPGQDESTLAADVARRWTALTV